MYTRKNQKTKQIFLLAEPTRRVSSKRVRERACERTENNNNSNDAKRKQINKRKSLHTRYNCIRKPWNGYDNWMRSSLCRFCVVVIARVGILYFSFECVRALFGSNARMLLCFSPTISFINITIFQDAQAQPEWNQTTHIYIEVYNVAQSTKKNKSGGEKRTREKHTHTTRGITTRK